MKKYIALLLSLIMMLQVTACGESTGTEEPKKVPKAAQAASDEAGIIDVKELADEDLTDVENQPETVFTELNENSIGANAELMATLKNTEAPYEYKLNEEDYDTSFVLYERDAETWTPFISGKETTFTVSEEGVIDYSVKNKKNLKFTGKKAGECVITAEQNGKISTALVRVLALKDDRDSAHSVEYYMLYIANELSELDSETKAEYLLNLGEYAAVSLASGAVDGNLVNAMAAACLIYPHTYLINNYAALLMGRAQYQEALLWLIQADEANPNNPFILTNMGECCYELGDYEMAMVYTDMAIAAREDFGLAHLIQACVYAQRGDLNAYIESLFRSAKTCWNELTTTLMQDLYIRAKDYQDRYDKAMLTKKHLDILMEAAGYGTTSDGRDIIAHQISVPFPAPITSAALQAEDSYQQQAEAFSAQNDQLFEDSKYYEGSTRSSDVRHVFIARFHILYYEWLIDENDSVSAMFGEGYDRVMTNFEKDSRSMNALYEEQIDELWEEMQYHSAMGTGAMFAAPFDDSMDWESIMVEHGTWIAQHYEEYGIEIIKLQIKAMETEKEMWHKTLIKLEEEKMRGYESVTRPILEEYYQRMNAILGYMTDDTARKRFEGRVLYQINEEGICTPLGFAGAEMEDVNAYEIPLMALYSQLDQAYKMKDDRVEQKAQAALEQRRLAEAKAERETWGKSYQIGLPPLSPIQVYIGISGEGNLTYGYGAFGHDIMYERDPKTGNTIQTITSTGLAGVPGLGQLDKTVSDLKGIYDNISDLHELEGALITVNNVTGYAKGQVVGGLPSVDARETTGTINVYNKDGELIDSSRFRGTSVSGGAGLINIGVETTSTYRGRGQYNLINPISTKSKAKISIGGMTFEKEVLGELPGH